MESLRSANGRLLYHGKSRPCRVYSTSKTTFGFFVNSTNIIEKTKDNFLNPRAAKYLFSQDVRFEGKPVNVTQGDNFEEVNENDINSCFTTIQQLHTELNAFDYQLHNY